MSIGIKGLLTCCWESEPRKPKRDFKGEYSELLASGRTYDFPDQESHLRAIEHNKKVLIEKCGFDKRLLEKMQKNGIEFFGDLRTKKCYLDSKTYTHIQRGTIGAFCSDAWV